MQNLSVMKINSICIQLAKHPEERKKQRKTETKQERNKERKKERNKERK